MTRARQLLLTTLLCAGLAACSQPIPTLVATLDASGLTVTYAAQPSASETPAPLSPTSTSVPSATATLAPSATPFPAARQLTQGGCCVRPFWSPDGSEVRFIDKPSDTAAPGLWGIDLEGGEPYYIAERPGFYSPDETMVVYPSGGQTVIERLDDGETWTVPSGGRPVNFSPDNQQIAWQIASSTINFDRRAVQIWVAAVDGSVAREVIRVVGGGLAGWFPDSQRLLITRRAEESNLTELAILDSASGELQVIAAAPRLRGVSLSPQGGWLAYQVTFSGDTGLDGLWLVRADGTQAKRLTVFGAYTWRGDDRLFLIPLVAGAASNRLLEVDAATGLARDLIDPATTPINIAEANWSLSPDGGRLAFVAAEDRNIWVLDLPQP
jgi:hypothetical protein